MNNRIIKNYIAQFQDMLNGDIWVDETFAKKLDHIPEDYPFKRPLPNVHSVAELVSHLLEWRLSVINILRGGTRTITDDSPSNWRDNKSLKAVGWQSLLSAFYTSQHALIDMLTMQDDSFLERRSEEDHTYEYYLNGMIHHDMYHLGQIGLVIKMLKTS